MGSFTQQQEMATSTESLPILCPERKHWLAMKMIILKINKPEKSYET